MPPLSHGPVGSRDGEGTVNLFQAILLCTLTIQALIGVLVALLAQVAISARTGVATHGTGIQRAASTVATRARGAGIELTHTRGAGRGDECILT